MLTDRRPLRREIREGNKRVDKTLAGRVGGCKVKKEEGRNKRQPCEWGNDKLKGSKTTKRQGEKAKDHKRVGTFENERM